MDSELPFHRVIFFPDVELQLPRCDPTMEVLPMIFFVESALDHVLHTEFRVFKCPMPVSLEVLEQKIPQEKVFDSVIGAAIGHSCAISYSIHIAESHGFVMENWFRLEGQDSRESTKYFLDVVRSEIKPVNLSLIHMMSFAIHLTSCSLKNKKYSLVYDIIWSVVQKLGERFPYEWIYESLHHWALTYNFRHNDIHKTWSFQDFIEEGLDEIAGETLIGWKS